VFSKWLSEPVDDGGEVNESQEVEVQFFIPCADPAKPFDSLEEVFNVMALAIGIGIVRPRVGSIAPGRDARRAAAIINAAADVIAIKPSISNHAFTGQKDDFLRRNCVASLPGCQSGLKDLPSAVHGYDELGVQSAFCAPKCLQMLAPGRVGCILVDLDMGRIQKT
jgi:hypothetical protein